MNLEEGFLLEDLNDFLLAAESQPTQVIDWEAQIDSIAQLGMRLNHLSTVDEIGTAICLELCQLIDYHNVRVYRVHGDDVVLPRDDALLNEILRSAVLCNDATLEQSPDTGWRVHGDPMEGALIVAAVKGGLDLEATAKRWPTT